MMSIKRLIIICTLPSFLVGCAEFYGSQPPAPVYGGQPKIQRPSSGSQENSKSHSTLPRQTVKTEPLKEFSEIKSEPLPLSEPVSSESVSVETPESSLPPTPSFSETQEVSPSPSPPEQLTPFEPINATVPLSPAVGALVSAANQDSQSGDLDSAAVAIERAIRIEPRNATLFYKLALLRLKQAKPRLAEDLAKKSALLASTDSLLKKHCWLLIAHAREIEHDFVGAKEARAKADGF
ncbi:MAG: tetratricopeptide repeat protein [Methylobacter sp.]|nr:MAG: tetratricopeptide repeat protein [Methylobacter sp.]